MAGKKYIDDCGGLKPVVIPPIKKTEKKTAKKKVKRQPKK